MATLVVYPQAGGGGTNITCDGMCENKPGSSEALATLQAGPGTNAITTEDSTSDSVGLGTSTTTNEFNLLVRYFFTFDTSSLNVTYGVTISAATFSIDGTGKNNGLGSDTLDLVGATLANANTIADADLTNVGSTVFASVAYASFSTSGYNNFSLNASGISNIKTNGVSEFALMSSFDLNDFSGGTWAENTYTGYGVYYADNGATTTPELSITYTMNTPVVSIGIPNTSIQRTIGNVVGY